MHHVSVKKEITMEEKVKGIARTQTKFGFKLYFSKRK
jgi:hypothetical protein